MMNGTPSPFPPSPFIFVRASHRFNSSPRARAVPSFTSAARASSTAGPHALLYQRPTLFDPSAHIEVTSAETCCLSTSSQPTRLSYLSPEESQSRRYFSIRSLNRPVAEQQSTQSFRSDRK